MRGTQLLENFLQALTAGLLNGAVYGLMCVGLSVIFGVMRVINFAQGDFMMLGMYLAYYASGLLLAHTASGPELAPYLAALIAGPIVFLAGIAVHRLLIRGVTGMRGSALESEGHYAQLILTLGVALILQNGGLMLFGSAPVSIATPLSSNAWSIGPLIGEAVEVFVKQAQSLAALSALAAVAGFVLLMNRSRLGKSLRAAADNPQAALEAVGLAGRAAVARALRGMDLTDGAARYFPGGGLSFDDNGRRVGASLLIVQWQKGAPVTIYPPKDALASPA